MKETVLHLTKKTSKGGKSLKRKFIDIIPFGSIPIHILETISKSIDQYFSYPSRILPPIEEPAYAYFPMRKQYHSTKILKKLNQMAKSDTIRILGITVLDLYIPILTYVFGEAQLGGKCAMVSFYRLLPPGSTSISSKIIHDRIAKVAIHELGHTFNLVHCKNNCVMHISYNLKDIEATPSSFCYYCNILFQDEVKKLNKQSIK